MNLTRLIDFCDPVSGWEEVRHFAGDYYAEDIEKPFHFLNLEQSQADRKVIDIYNYRRQIDELFFWGQEMIFFEKFIIVQFWSDENFVEDTKKPHLCSIGFQDQRWLLNEGEGFVYEQKWNPTGCVPPTAVGVAIIKNARRRIIKRVIVTPLGGKIL